LFVGEIEGLGPAPLNRAEFHQGLIIACRIETDRHVPRFVLVDEEHASEQNPLGFEGGISGPVGTHVAGGKPLLLPDRVQYHSICNGGRAL